MAAVKTNDAFLREKLTNFAAFLEGLLKSRPKGDPRIAKAQAKINELKTIDTAIFLLHITNDMLPYKLNIKAYVAKMISEDGTTVDELTPAEFEKLSRYISLFIDIVSE